jgi:acetyl esterase
MHVDKQVQSILDQFKKFKPQKMETLTPDAARNNPTLKNAVEEITAEHVAYRIKSIFSPIPEPVKSITHLTIPTPNGPLLARVFAPEGSASLPVIVYFHGGGWVIANLDVYEASCRALCNSTQAIVVSVAYRLAPENKYPAAVEDAYNAVQWIFQNASKFHGDSSKIVVCGESAGGNLAAVTCLKARMENGRMPIAQILIYPVTDGRMQTTSMQEFTDTLPLYRDMMPWFWNNYLKNDTQKQEVFASPLLADSLKDLPPAFVVTAEFDPLRDEGEEYAKKLLNDGVSVKSKRYKGMVHEFFGLAGAVDGAKECLDDITSWLKEQFKQQY